MIMTMITNSEATVSPPLSSCNSGVSSTYLLEPRCYLRSITQPNLGARSPADQLAARQTRTTQAGSREGDPLPGSFCFGSTLTPLGKQLGKLHTYTNGLKDKLEPINFAVACKPPAVIRTPEFG